MYNGGMDNGSHMEQRGMVKWLMLAGAKNRLKNINKGVSSCVKSFDTKNQNTKNEKKLKKTKPIIL